MSLRTLHIRTLPGDTRVYFPQYGSRGFSRVIVDVEDPYPSIQIQKVFNLNWPGTYVLRPDGDYGGLYSPIVKVRVNEYVWCCLEYTLQGNCSWPRKTQDAKMDGDEIEEAPWFAWDEDGVYYWLGEDQGEDSEGHPDPNITPEPYTEKPEEWNSAAENSEIDYDPDRDPNLSEEEGDLGATRMPSVVAEGQKPYPKKQGWCQAVITVHKNENLNAGDTFYSDVIDWEEIFPDLTPVKDYVEAMFDGYYCGYRLTNFSIESTLLQEARGYYQYLFFILATLLSKIDVQHSSIRGRIERIRSEIQSHLSRSQSHVVSN